MAILMYKRTGGVLHLSTKGVSCVVDTAVLALALASGITKMQFGIFFKDLIIS